MKTVLASLTLLLLVTAQAEAIKITLFTDTDTFVQRAHDIMIAKCIGPVPDGRSHIDGLYAVDVEVMAVLKGARKTGKARIAPSTPW